MTTRFMFGSRAWWPGVCFANRAESRIIAFGPDGREKVFAESVSANSIVITAQSSVYFADAMAETIVYIEPTGKVVAMYRGGEIALPSGLALSPEKGMLVVTDGQSRYSWSFQIAKDGSPINGEPFYRLEMPEERWMSGVSSTTEDTIGQVYFATPLEIQMCEANGQVPTILNPPTPGGACRRSRRRPEFSVALPPPE